MPESLIVIDALSPPPWMRSLTDLPLRARRLLSPKMKRMASQVFDLPDPFGPMMQLKPCDRGMRTALNDLKLRSVSSPMVAM
ncbi:Uncharacterised protein [uncultured archaeon]|nr:Uncharacterised protein [uncultured archaeon]